jgi:hypothetical protein
MCCRGSSAIRSESLYEREFDPFLAAEYLEKCAEFSQFVETDSEPPAARGSTSLPPIP